MDDLIKAWVKCPSCGAERYHLIGERHEEKTGEMVDSLEVTSPIKVGFVREGDLPDLSPLAIKVFSRELIVTFHDRECRVCSHVWSEEIGRRSDRPPVPVEFGGLPLPSCSDAEPGADRG